MKRARIVTADEIIRGAMRARRPKVRFPGLSFDLEAQAMKLVRKSEGTHVRQTASPFVKDILSKRWKP